MRAANELEPFRYRLDGPRVRVFDVVHGSTAVLRDDDSIAFADLDWDRDFARFAQEAGARIRAVQRGERPFDATPERQDVLHFTTLPWLDFTSFSHARNWGRDDAVPKIAFGRLQAAADGRWRMAMAVEVHHALMDGLHVGRLVQLLQARLDDPAPWLI
ncbi:MAG: CatA-like O-acetyltransferase [Rubrivivax sp.]